MKFPKWATTVTSFSKLMALIVFIIFLVIAAYLGYFYGKYSPEADPSTFQSIKPSPMMWNKYRNDIYNISLEYPSDTKTFIELNDTLKFKNSQKIWHLILTNQGDYPRLENNLNGKGYYYIQIISTDSSNYDIPLKGKTRITKDNFNNLLGNESYEKGFLSSRPTLKFKETTYPKHGSIDYVIYDNDRIIEINAVSDNLDLIPFASLDKIVSSFQLH